MADPVKQQEKEAKRQERAMKRARRKETRSQLWQAFNMQRKQDKMLVPIMLACILGMGLLFFLIGLLFHGQWFLLPLGLAIGFMLAMYVFTRRVEASVYDKAAGSPGAAGWALENLRNSVGVVWHTKTAVAGNRNMDLVHRVVGVPGVVLVGEGNPQRVKQLMAQQKRRLDRIAGGVPVYEIIAGDGEGEVPLKNLQRELLKLPRNYKKGEVYSIASKIDAMDAMAGGGKGQLPGMPKGPVPKGAKVSGMNRRARRTAERNHKG